MQSGSPSHTSWTAAAEAKPRCIYSILKPTQSEFQMAKSDCSCRGKAKERILNFKSTWSEFQKPSQTAAMRGEAELRIRQF